MAMRFIVLAVLSGGSFADDEQCTLSSGAGCGADADVEESSVRWLPLHSLQKQQKKAGGFDRLLQCSGQDQEDLAKFCLATRPESLAGSCTFTDTLSMQVLEDQEQASCWRQCLFDTPDLSAYASYPVASKPSVTELHMVPMTRKAYDSTPFLDSRSRKHGIEACNFVVELPVLERLIASAPEAAKSELGNKVHFIFHLAHTGSTLLSRAIGEASNAFVLREPRLLWDLSVWMASASAKKVGKAWNGTLLPVLSRKYSSKHTVIVKASSKAVRFMRPALKFSSQVRAIFMYCSLRTHLAVVLARALTNDNERLADDIYEGLEVKQQAFKDFSASSPAYRQLSLPRKMALAWAKRMLFVLALPKEQVMLLRMDHFLDETPQQLQEVAKFFGLSMTAAKAKSIASSDIFTQYAKDSSVPWNSTIQKQMMAGRSQVYAKQIDDGMVFAAELLDKHSALRKHLKTYLTD